MPKFNVKPTLNVSQKKALSLFSGMGGDSLGIVNSGWELIAYSEKDKVFRQTHDLNFDQRFRRINKDFCIIFFNPFNYFFSKRR